jgi:hypothetical protein
MPYGDIKRLNSATAQLAATTGVLYTAPASKKAQIGTILAQNTGTTPRVIELFDSGTGNANRLIYAILPGNDTYEFSPKVPLVLEGGETLQGKASAASEVNIKLFGREET